MTIISSAASLGAKPSTEPEEKKLLEVFRCDYITSTFPRKNCWSVRFSLSWCLWTLTETRFSVVQFFRWLVVSLVGRLLAWLSQHGWPVNLMSEISQMLTDQKHLKSPSTIYQKPISALHNKVHISGVFTVWYLRQLYQPKVKRSDKPTIVIVNKISIMIIIIIIRSKTSGKLRSPWIILDELMKKAISSCHKKLSLIVYQTPGGPIYGYGLGKT